MNRAASYLKLRRNWGMFPCCSSNQTSHIQSVTSRNQLVRRKDAFLLQNISPPGTRKRNYITQVNIIKRFYSGSSFKFIQESYVKSNQKGINTKPNEKDSESKLMKAVDVEESSSSSFMDLPGTVHAKHKLAIIYTCKVCSTRSGKMIGKQAYDNGVVIVRCPGCDNLHLIADRLQFFEDESWDIEKGLAKYGEKVTAVNEDNILELTPKDIIGERSEV